MGEYRVLPRSGCDVSTGEVVGDFDGHAAGRGREFFGKRGRQSCAGTRRSRALECPSDCGYQFLMRRLFLLHVLFVALAGVLPARAADLPQPTPDIMEAGRKLYTAKCARCHKFYDPAKYSDAKWRDWMDKMSKKAKLKPAQKQILSEYLETFRTGTKTNNAAAPH